MKKIVAVIVVAVAAVSMWELHSKAVEARREASYREALGPFQSDPRAGMTRVQVQAYLDSRKLTYTPIFWAGSGNAWSYAIRIGKEPGAFVCDSRTV
jgi:hypothetical protein